MVFPVLRKGKRTNASEREPDGRKPRKKQGHGLGVLIERGTVMLAKLCFFPAHDNGIEQCKIAAQNHSRYPRVSGNGCRERKNGASEIERISRIGIGTSNGEHFLLVQMPGGAGPDK